MLISPVRPTDHTVRQAIVVCPVFLVYRGPYKVLVAKTHFYECHHILAVFRRLVFLTLIFPSADNKVPIQAKPVCGVCVCVCVCGVCVCVQEILNKKSIENPLLISRIMC